MIQFKGVKAPPLNVPLIELETATGRLVDLYNECQLEAVVLRGGELTFSFVSDAEGTPIVLRFDGVQRLSVVQPEGWVPQEASQIEHLLIRSQGPWRELVLKAGGLEYEFDCATVILGNS